jgi:hypothetical protein
MSQQAPPYGDLIVDRLVEEFFEENEAGAAYIGLCKERGWPFIIDHITIRCFDIDHRAKLFLKKGYVYQDEIVEYPDQGWWAKVYRKPCFPALFIDQAYSDSLEKSIIPAWVKRFGEETLHHVAVLVTDIEMTIEGLKAKGIEFPGEIVGGRGTRLRQIFTAAEVRDGAPFSVLELTERNGYNGFYPEQANSLMQSSIKTKSQET